MRAGAGGGGESHILAQGTIFEGLFPSAVRKEAQDIWQVREDYLTKEGGLTAADWEPLLAALKRDTWLDYSATFLAMIGQVIPAYVIAVLLIILFAVTLRWLPTSGWGPMRQAILPVVAVALGPMATSA